MLGRNSLVTEWQVTLHGIAAAILGEAVLPWAQLLVAKACVLGKKSVLATKSIDLLVNSPEAGHSIAPCTWAAHAHLEGRADLLAEDRTQPID